MRFDMNIMKKEQDNEYLTYIFLNMYVISGFVISDSIWEL